MKKIKEIYLYVFVFALIYIEFGYQMVVENQMSGNTRILILLLLTIPLLGSAKKIGKKAICLFLYFLILILINVMRDGTFSNYILLFVPIYIGYVVAECIDFEKLVEVYVNIIAFLAMYSLIMFVFSLLIPGVIQNLPVLGYRLDTKALMHDAFFAVCISNSVFVRNYGIAWEPGAFALLLCVALYCLLVVRKEDKPYKTIIVIVTIITTFSTMGYFVMVCILFAVLNQKNILGKKQRMMIGVAVICMIIFVFRAPDSITDLVFSKLTGLFSNDKGNMAYTTQARLDAIKYPFKAFISSPLIGVGYEEFAYINKTFCNGVATNTILNWFAVMGCLFGMPCLYYYIKLIGGISKQYRLHRFGIMILIVAAMLLISTESLLRISMTYILMFYGCKIKTKDRKNENTLYFRRL